MLPLVLPLLALPPPLPPPICKLHGLALNFEASDLANDPANDINWLGGFPGSNRSVCTDSITWNTQSPPEGCPCGCGCQCSGNTLTNRAHEMRLKRAGRLFEGSSNESHVLDLVIRNITEYRPWNSSQNGRNDGGTFAQISLAANQSLTMPSLRIRGLGRPDGDIDTLSIRYVLLRHGHGHPPRDDK